MLVPEALFGTQQSVSRRVSKLVTQLKRGARLEELLANAPTVDLREHVSAFVWLDARRVMRGKTQLDFRALLLGQALSDPKRIPFELSNVIRERRKSSRWMRADRPTRASRRTAQ